MNMKAISPVIATVIIVSVAIAIAVAVAFWMTGITGLFTRYEKLEIVTAYADSNFNVYLTVRNTGTTSVTIDQVFINGIPAAEAHITSMVYDTETITDLNNIGIGLNPGDEVDITITLNSTYYEHGQIIEVKLHTAAGNEYPKSVQLP